MITGAGGEGHRGVTTNGKVFLSRGDGNALKLGCSDGCTTLRTY